MTSTQAEVVERLHGAQAVMHPGGDDAGVRKVLAPGTGDDAGVRALLAPARAEGGHVAALPVGTAHIGGAGHAWSVVGLCGMRDGRLAECRLLPLDPVAFDRICEAGA